MNGLLIQWGKGISLTQVEISEYKSLDYALLVSPILTSASVAGNCTVNELEDLRTETSFTAQFRWNGNGTYDYSFRWFTIGY